MKLLIPKKFSNSAIEKYIFLNIKIGGGLMSETIVLLSKNFTN